MYTLLCLFPQWWASGRSRLLPVVNNAAVSMEVQISLWDRDLTWLYTQKWDRWVILYIVLVLMFWGSSILFSVVAAPVYIPINIYFCFIDYAKAFDCVDHKKLWKILKEMGIPDHLTCLLRNLYADLEATVRTGHGPTDKKQESSRKTSISAVLTMPKPLTVWITINCGKFWKRWEYQTTWPAS